MVTVIRVKTDFVGSKALEFYTARAYRRTVLRVLAICRRHADKADCADAIARDVCEEIPHLYFWNDDAPKSQFHVNVDCGDRLTYVGMNDDRDTWGCVGFAGRTDDIDWHNSKGPEVLSCMSDYSDV